MCCRGYPKSGRRCAPRGVPPLSPRPERSGSNDRQKENGSHPSAGDGTGKAEAGASGQAVRPVPVRISPAGRNWETCGGVSPPAVPCPLSAGILPQNSTHKPLSPELREECRRLDAISRQAQLICREKLDRLEDVADFSVNAIFHCRLLSVSEWSCQPLQVYYTKDSPKSQGCHPVSAFPRGPERTCGTRNKAPSRSPACACPAPWGREYLPLFLNDAVPEEHKSSIDMSRDLLRRSRVLVVCGHAVTEAVKNDIAVAQRLKITATTLEGILTVKGQGRC